MEQRTACEARRCKRRLVAAGMQLPFNQRKKDTAMDFMPKGDKKEFLDCRWADGRGCAGFGRDKKRRGLLDWYFNNRPAPQKPREGAMARTTPMRIEPKTFFANERTFLSWCGFPKTLNFDPWTL